MKLSLDDLRKLHETEPALQRLGFVVDTNALFAIATPSDRLNTWAHATFRALSKFPISAYSNINIRTEFMDLQRRVMIPEGLVSFYDVKDKDSMNLHLKTQLRSLKTQMERATKEERVFKLSDQAIKKYRAIIETGSPGAWELFCRDFLYPQISEVGTRRSPS